MISGSVLSGLCQPWDTSFGLSQLTSQTGWKPRTQNDKQHYLSPTLQLLGKFVLMSP